MRQLKYSGRRTVFLKMNSPPRLWNRVGRWLQRLDIPWKYREITILCVNIYERRRVNWKTNSINQRHTAVYGGMVVVDPYRLFFGNLQGYMIRKKEARDCVLFKGFRGHCSIHQKPLQKVRKESRKRSDKTSHYKLAIQIHPIIHY